MLCMVLIFIAGDTSVGFSHGNASVEAEANGGPRQRSPLRDFFAELESVLFAKYVSLQRSVFVLPSQMQHIKINIKNKTGQNILITTQKTDICVLHLVFRVCICDQK